MSELSAAEISHLAKLARISLNEEELAKFGRELPKIVEFVEQLRQVKLEADLPEPRTAPLESLRDDVVSSEHLSLEQLKALAPEWQDNQNVVPAVFGQESEADA